MKDDTKLPRELLWDGAHVSELALTAIADGQEKIVQRDAIEHADACEWCAGRMGRAALLSAAVAGAVMAARPIRATASSMATSSPPAWKALALGLAVAVIAAIPTLSHLTSTAVDLLAYGKTFTSHGIPVLARGGVALATSQTASRALSLATAASSMLLVMMGWAIARTRSPETSDRSVS